MNWMTAFKKGGLGLLTFVGAYVAANPQVLSKLLPDNIEQMTIGGLVAAGVVFVTNWLKNRTK